MAWVGWLFLESFTALAGLLFVVNFVLLVYWRRSRRGRPLLVGLAVSAGLLTVQTLVVTRKEHALRIMAALVQDVRTARTEAFQAHLTPDFRMDRLDKAEFLSLLERFYDEVRVRDVRNTQFRVVAAERDEFRVTTTYLADVTGQYRGWHISVWDIGFVRSGAGWHIAAIECLEIDGQRQPNWRSLSH